MSDTKVIDNPALKRFEFHVDDQTAFILYDKDEQVVRMVHTEVPDALRGQGVGSKLVGGALQLSREKSLSVIPLCPFVVDYLKRHPEYMDVVEPAYRRLIQESA